MTLWTRAELEEQITSCKKAIKAAISGHSYGIEGRSLTRQSLPELRKQLAYLEGELAALNGKRGPAFVTARVRR